MRVSCLIPAYNEATRVPAVIRAACACPDVDEIIVVSDGSTDHTVRCAADAGADRVITFAHNQGKGAAILAAAAQAQGEVLVLLDADLCGIQPGHISQLLAPVRAGQAEMAVGVFTGDRRHGLLPRLSGQRALHRRLLAHAEALAATGFGFEIALDHLARRRRARVLQVPLAGVSHQRKRQKYGTVKGLRQEMRASSDVLHQLRLVATAWRGLRGSRKRRSRSVGVALLVFVTLLVLFAPVFLLSPSDAAHVSTRSPLQPGDRVLLVVAHPDDEVIGAGGLMGTAHRTGVPVSVVVVTNGDSNRVSAALIGRHLRSHAADFVKTGIVRQGETIEGLRRLGVATDQVFFFGFPDRALADVLASEVPVTSPFTLLRRAAYPGVVAPEAPYTAPALAALLQQVVEQVRPTVIITHAPFDRHPDHRAVYALVEAHRGGARLYTFLVHAQGFPRPLRLASQEPLLPPAALSQPLGWSWVEFALSPEAVQDKRHAIDAHRSQIHSPYLRLLLASFVRRNELFAVPRDANAFSGTTR
ncbi:MAG: PIG-L family deacetylase [Armatimonadetes bacterium]|nr:PIG-L family deacetylase [Armatimonadota bacterium]